VDACFHDYWARALLSGNYEDLPPGAAGMDPEIQEHPYFRPPGYPLFLGGAYALCGASHEGARAIQMALGLVNVLLAFFLSRRLFGPACGLITAAFMGGYWIFIYYEGQLQAPVVLIFLLLSLFHVCRLLMEKITWIRALAAGLLVGLYALVRPNILLFLPVLLAVNTWWTGRKAARGPRSVLWAGLLLGAVCAILPATLRNVLVGGDFVLISANAGVNLYIGNNEKAEGRFITDIPDLEGYGTSFDYATVVSRLERKLGRPMRYSEVSSYFTQRAFRFIMDHPLEFTRLLVRKAGLLFGPEEVTHNNVVKWDRRFSPVLSRIPGSFSWVLALAVIGLLLLGVEARRAHERRKCVPYIVLILLFILTYAGSFLPFFATSLYRVPLIPFMLILGAFGVERILCMIKERKILRALGWTLAAGALYTVMALNLDEPEPGEPDPALSTWHLGQGISHEHGQHTQAAMASYEKALEAFEENYRARFYLGRLKEAQGRIVEASRDYQEALRIHPRFFEAHFKLAGLEARGHDLEKALFHFNRAVMLRPESGEARFHLANALALLGRLEEAQGHYETVLIQWPDHAQVLCNLGAVLARQERFEEAAARYREALRVQPDYARALTNLGLALTQLGSLEEAARCFEEALEIQPEDPTAREGLERIRRGDHGKR
jgi:tetratricopeptide (TPR) repeat protein